MAAADDNGFSERNVNLKNNADYSKDDVQNIKEEYFLESSGSSVTIALGIITCFIIFFTICKQSIFFKFIH